MQRTTRLAASGTAVVLAAGGVLAGGVATAAPPATDQARISALQTDLVWGECPRPSPAPLPEGLECTTLEVPLDYRDPDGQTIELAVSRVRAEDPTRRRGVLLVNPGGPGGSGLITPGILVELGMPESVTDQYDLIGFDPRGVGYSTPVTCGFSEAQRSIVAPEHPVDADDVARRMTVVQQLADQCAQANPDGYLRHITTANTARDMDRIREALGEERISYLGYSYGTYLGSVYAQLFPGRTDRIVLDSAVNPEWVWREQFRRWGQGGEAAFGDFAEWLAARDDEYGMGSTPEEVRQLFLDLAEGLDETPLGDIDGTQFRWITFTNLYNENRYQSTVSLWRAALERDVAAAATMRPTQTSLQVPLDNQQASQLTILCSDVRWPTDVEHYQQAVADDRAAYPLFGAMAANAWPCAAWPYDPIEPPVEIDETAAQNGVLILQNLRDPATVLEGAERLRDILGADARIVRIDEAGHSAYLFDDNACAFDIASAYLAEGALPDDDVLCPAGSSAALQHVDDETRSAALRELVEPVPSLTVR